MRGGATRGRLRRRRGRGGGGKSEEDKSDEDEGGGGLQRTILDPGGVDCVAVRLLSPAKPLEGKRRGAASSALHCKAPRGALLLLKSPPPPPPPHPSSLGLDPPPAPPPSSSRASANKCISLMMLLTAPRGCRTLSLRFLAPCGSFPGYADMYGEATQ